MKTFSLLEFNEDTLVLDVTDPHAPRYVSTITFAYGRDLMEKDDEDDRVMEQFVRALGWNYAPLEDWHVALLGAAMRCARDADEVTKQPERGPASWFMDACVYQADLMYPDLAGRRFGPGVVIDSVQTDEAAATYLARTAYGWGWRPCDGRTDFHDTTDIQDYAEGALEYLSRYCCAPGCHLAWADHESGLLLCEALPEPVLPF